MVTSIGFALYFQKQWVEGQFNKWKVFNSPAGCATTKISLESFNTMLKKCFMDHKHYKVGKCIAFILLYSFYLLNIVLNKLKKL
jgi:hypothetical protein